MQAGQYELAIQFFHKVLAKDPGSGWVHNLLSTIYTLYQPNTEAYLRHAIQSIPYSVAGQDSATISFAYLHLGNALAQNGFLVEAEPYLEKSLGYQPDNLFSNLLSIYVEMGQGKDMELAYQRLQGMLARDSTFLAAQQEMAKIAYYRGEYELAWDHYRRFFALEAAAGLDMYPDADINVAYLLEQLGRPDEAVAYRERYLAHLQEDESIYRDLGFAVYYAAKGENDQGIASLRAFAEQEDYQFWFVMFLDEDPLLQRLATDPDYSAIIAHIRKKFWTQHQKMRGVLEAEGVM